MTTKENKAWMVKLVSVFIAILLSVLGWAGSNVYDNLVKADEINHAEMETLDAKFEQEISSINKHLYQIDSTLLISQMLDSIATDKILNSIGEIKGIIE